MIKYYNIFDTIVSLSTPMGNSGVAIVRISGYLSNVISIIFLRKYPLIRYAEYSIFWFNNKDILDIGISIYFNSPISFTGEDIFESYLHCNNIIINYYINKIISIGCRQSKPRRIYF